MNNRFLLLCAFLSLTPSVTLAGKPIKALLIAGGCCHDYKGQTKAISDGIQARANVQVDVYWTSDGSTNPPLPLYNKATWASGYDVIIHDECAASNKDVAVTARILAVHEKIPAVHLHCAMHSFRNGTDAWARHLGLLSTSHGPQEPIEIQFTDTDHPITQGLKNWTTIKEELYNNAKMYDAHPLATGKQLIRRGDKTRTAEAVVAWTNEKSGARSFSTTIGHNTKTVADDRYLDLITRGLLWSCDKLNDEYLTPFEGKNKIRFNEAMAAELAKRAKKKTEAMLKKMPADATLVKITASSVQNGNEIASAMDADTNTRWCASNSSYPQWLAFEFEKPTTVTKFNINWEFSHAYQYVVESSIDGKTWSTLSDHTNNQVGNPFDENVVDPKPIKHMRITGLGGKGWCSIREVRIEADDVKSFWPAMPGNGFKPVTVQGDPFKKSGNVPPEIAPYSANAEADILKKVKVPEGFVATVFAAPPAVNYPVFVAAAPDGTLYVSSDGNGSLGRDPSRGRVIRLRDKDGDGRADETKVFCEIDSPRGLVWDHDRLYLMHPPHLSVFIDKDGDGVSDEQKILVKNLAFGYDKRPADHTTNGLSLGVDGYLYIAGGDFGFMDAEGSDGRKLTHRGGGVIRVRPDGSGLEIYSTGTRNILEVAISPQMDIFARDNTNDGGGWDVRFHHFTGGEDHGYPRLYKNFADECIAPLADYGGGSGCGAVYLDEPGFGKWNGAPMTADWGRGAIYHHQVKPKGATFVETQTPEKFIAIERATDADVDGMSRMYAASWRGASFSWAGPNVGFVVCVRPKEYHATPLPDFATLSDDELIALFDSPSYRRRVAAQRELVRRGNPASEQLLSRAKKNRHADRNLVDRLQNEASDAEVIKALSHTDPVVVHVAIRSLASRNAWADCFDAIDRDESSGDALLRSLAMMHQSEVVTGLIHRYEKNQNAELRRGILRSLCRLHFIEGKWSGQSWGTRPDTRGPYYQPEPWSETDRIASLLKAEMDQANAEDAAMLVQEMNRNRIHFDQTTTRIISLAAKNQAMIPDAVALVAATNNTSTEALKLLVPVTSSENADAQTLANAVTALSRYDRPDVIKPILAAIDRLSGLTGANRELQSSKNAFFRSRLLGNQIAVVCALANDNPSESYWADAAILHLGGQKNSSPEAKAACQKSIEQGWEDSKRKLRLINAATQTRNHMIDEQILASLDDKDPKVAKAVAEAIKRLKLTVMEKVDSPLVETLDVETAVAQVVSTKGNRDLGERLFAKANCTACHTVSKDVAQKGPYLGNIAQTYKRPDLAAAILQPSKTIAQGFATTSILTDDGKLIVGFVTKESSNEVIVRDKEAKEFTISKDIIELRKTLKTSIMPKGLVDKFTIHDVASIVDYLQSLSKK